MCFVGWIRIETTTSIRFTRFEIFMAVNTNNLLECTRLYDVVSQGTIIPRPSFSAVYTVESKVKYDYRWKHTTFTI
jgi:hypothetical protein